VAGNEGLREAADVDRASADIDLAARGRLRPEGGNVPFQTKEGNSVPAVTAEQMREVDRIAVEEFGLSILQMMENAGRNLAQHVMDMLDGIEGEVTVLAGSGGNGGGGLCCARHLHNRGVKIQVVLSRAAATLTGAARNQLQVLQAAGVHPVEPWQAKADVDPASADVDPASADIDRTSEAVRRSQVVVDALIGYSLRGAPRGTVAELIDLCNQRAARVLSLDVPSGLDTTTGEAPGRIVRPERTLTLALPKTGLEHVPGKSTWPTSASRQRSISNWGCPSSLRTGKGIGYAWKPEAIPWLLPLNRRQNVVFRAGLVRAPGR